MKIKSLIALASIIIGMSSPVFAGSSYQATGPILELTDTKIVIMKDKEKWEIARTPDTKVTGELIVGAKVTIQYSMSAVSVEVKPAKPTPAGKTKPAPVDKTKPAPADKAKPAPAGKTKPAPADKTKPAPEGITKPASADDAKPAE